MSDQNLMSILPSSCFVFAQQHDSSMALLSVGASVPSKVLQAWKVYIGVLEIGEVEFAAKAFIEKHTGNSQALFWQILASVGVDSIEAKCKTHSVGDRKDTTVVSVGLDRSLMNDNLPFASLVVAAQEGLDPVQGSSSMRG